MKAPMKHERTGEPGATWEDGFILRRQQTALCFLSLPKITGWPHVWQRRGRIKAVLKQASRDRQKREYGDDRDDDAFAKARNISTHIREIVTTTIP